MTRPVAHLRLLKSWRVTILPHMAGSTMDADRVGGSLFAFWRVPLLIGTEIRRNRHEEPRSILPREWEATYSR